MTLTEVLQDYWGVVSAAAAYLFWLGRLEMKVFQASKDQKDMETRMATQRAEDLANRQRDWDKMNDRLNTIQDDIKELLQRTAK